MYGHVKITELCRSVLKYYPDGDRKRGYIVKYFMCMYVIYGLGKITELCRPVLKYSPADDRKRVTSKTSSVTGCFILYHFFDSARPF